MPTSQEHRPGSINSRTDSAALTGVTDAAGLTDAIERGIVSGELGPGDRLSPVRTLAKDLGLAPNTVAAAYRKLQDRGLLEGQGRRGTFVSERGPVDLNPADVTNPAVPTGVVDLASGTPDPSLLPDLAAAVVSANSGGASESQSVGYGDNPVHTDLAAAIQGWARVGTENEPRRGASSTEEHTGVAIVGGALDGIERTLATRLRPGDVVAVEDPTYPAVLALLAAMGLRPAPVPIDDRGLLPEALRTTLADGAHAVIATPRAQNPTGAALDAERAHDLASVLAGYPGALIIEDDYAGPVAGAEHHSIVSDSSRRWTTITSVAKSLGPDLRVAAVTGDRTTVARVTDRQLLGTGWVSHVLQRTAASLLADDAVARSLETTATRYRDRRNHFIGELAAVGVAATGRSGLNVWVPVADEAEVVAAMQADGFAVRAGSRFRLDSPPGIRVTTASADRTTLSAAAAALAGVLTRRTAGRSA